MITETGRVAAVGDDCLWVETIQTSTCESCAAEKGCGQRLVAKWGGKTSFIRVLLEGRDPSSYALHDSVTIAIPDDVVANGSLLVYMTPLLSMLIGLLFAQWLALPELGVIALSLSGLLLGGVAVRFHSYLRRDDRRVQPVLVDGLEPLNWSANVSPERHYS